MSAFCDCEKRMQQLIDNKAMMISKIRSKESALEGDLEKVTADAQKAAQLMQDEAYCNAMERKHAIDEKKAMYDACLEEIKSKPLIDEIDYTDGVNAILAEQLEAEMTARAELVALIDQAVQIKEELLKKLHRGDELLLEWHAISPKAAEKAPEFDWRKKYASGYAVGKMEALVIYRDAKGLK